MYVYNLWSSGKSNEQVQGFNGNGYKNFKGKSKNNSKQMKKLILTAVLIFVFLCNLYPQSGWQIQTPPASQWYVTVYFINENTGWIANHDDLLKTTNKGVNWIVLSNNFAMDVSDIQFMNELTGYVVGSTAGIRKTTNGGLNWIFASCPECNNSDDFMQIQFLDENTGYAIGDWRIFKSTNAGLNWEPLDISSGVFRGQFFNLLTGWFAGQGRFTKTTNGGVNWVQNIFFTNSFTTDLFFVNLNTGWIVSYSGEIFKTTNGGDNWSLQYKDSTIRFNDIVFTTNNTGWAIAENSISGNNGIVLKTTNAGLNWFSQQVPGTGYFEIFMLNSNEGWLAGDYLLHTTDGGGSVGIKKIISEIPSAFSLEQNYPNPFNPTTKIQFKVSSSKFVKLVVLDILGKEVATLVNESLQPGIYEVSFNAEGLSSGIYFYRLQTNNYKETKRMVLIK